MSRLGHNGAPTFSSDNGWVAIARSIRTHPLVGIHLFAKPADASRGAVQPMAAFIDLIMECRYEDGFVQNGGRKMEVKRGQMVGAVSWLAARWNWTPMAVRIWLDKLEADMMISKHVPGASKDNKHVGRTATVLSLCNYEQYQNGTTNQQQSKQQTNSNQTTNEQQQYKDNKETKEQGNNNNPSVPIRTEGVVENINSQRDREGDAPEFDQKLERQWKNATDRSDKIKGPRGRKRQNELNGLHGIEFLDGRLRVFNGVKAAIANDFPGVNIDAVCNKAAPALAKQPKQDHDTAVAVIRQYCQYEIENATKVASGKGTPPAPAITKFSTINQTLSALSPAKRQEFLEALAKKREAGNA